MLETCGVSGSKDKPTQNAAAKILPSIANLVEEPPVVTKAAGEEPAVIKSDETPAVLGHISKAEPDGTMLSTATTSVHHTTKVKAAAESAGSIIQYPETALS